MTGPNFQSVFYRQLWASNAKLMNFYMFYGYVLLCIHYRPFLISPASWDRGTSWGGLPFPGVYSKVDLQPVRPLADFTLASYDYGAALEESRQITNKFTDLKSQGLFLRSSPEFLKTNRIGNSTSGSCEVSNPSAFVTLLKNPDTGTCFWIARQTNSSSTCAHYIPLTRLTN